MDDTEWDIDGKCDQIGKSEKEPYEDKIIEKKSEEKNYRKVKNHPHKSLEAIGNIKIAKAISFQACLHRDDDRIGSMINWRY